MSSEWCQQRILGPLKVKRTAHIWEDRTEVISAIGQAVEQDQGKKSLIQLLLSKGRRRKEILPQSLETETARIQ